MHKLVQLSYLIIDFAPGFATWRFTTQCKASNILLNLPDPPWSNALSEIIFAFFATPCTFPLFHKKKSLSVHQVLRLIIEIRWYTATYTGNKATVTIIISWILIRPWCKGWTVNSTASKIDMININTCIN